MNGFFDDVPVDRNNLSDWDDLYQEVILDHYRAPRHAGELPPPAGHGQGFNRLCGDRVDVYVQPDGERLRDVRQRTCGCAICTASASLMAEVVQGRTRADVQALSALVQQRWVMGQLDGAWPDWAYKLEALDGVHQFPARVKCATLPWHTLGQALGPITKDIP